MKGKYMRRIGGIVLGALMLFGVTLATAACAFSLMNRRFFSGGRDWALISGRSGYLSDDFFTKEEGSVGKG